MIRFIKCVAVAGFTGLLVQLNVGCREAATDKSAEQILERAWYCYQIGEYGAAINEFETGLQLSEPGSENYLQTLYGLGMVWQLRRPQENREKASEYYHRILQLAPRHDLAAWSLLALARIQHLVPMGENPNYGEVRQAYHRVYEQFPDHMAGQEAYIYYYSTLAASLQEDDARTAIAALDKFISTHPDGAFISAAWSLKSVCYNTLRMPREKMDAEIMSFRTMEVDPDHPNQDQASRYWQLATIAEFDVGDFSTARHYYQRLIDEYPTDIRVYACESAIERMNATIARLLQGQQVPP
jgi:tetratricopeptide (TPR) repeat protein